MPRRIKSTNTETDNEIALKLRYLMDTYKKPDGKSYTYTEIAERTGGQINHSWLSKLADGQATRPGLKPLKAVTDFFGIDFRFWLISLEEWKAEKLDHEKRLTTKEINAQKIAVRASNLDERGQQVVLGVIQSLEDIILQERKKERDNEK
jgi:transcriptional regulator with XRE-family HTH domain